MLLTEELYWTFLHESEMSRRLAQAERRRLARLVPRSEPGFRGTLAGGLRALAARLDGASSPPTERPLAAAR